MWEVGADWQEVFVLEISVVGCVLLDVWWFFSNECVLCGMESCKNNQF
jgi:hypothetical protein